jgi:hypothetical protein
MMRALPWLLAALLCGCRLLESWDGLVYRNKFDLKSALDIGTFDTLEECRAAAQAKLREIRGGPVSTYVCGLDCRVLVGFDQTRMCARTAR